MKFYAIQFPDGRFQKHLATPQLFHRKSDANHVQSLTNGGKVVEVRVEIVGPVEVRKRKKKA